MATAKVLIERAMRTLQVLEAGNEADPQELGDGLDHIDELLREWELTGLMVPTVELADFPLSKIIRDYTWGTGGTMAGTRPSSILSAHMLDGAGNTYPVILLNAEEWAGILHKGSIARPAFVWIDNEYPLRNVRFSDFPYDPTARFTVRGTLPSPAAVTAEVTLDPGYDSAVRYNLAVRMAPEFAVTVSRELDRQARRSLRLVRNFNLTAPSASIDPVYAPRQRHYRTSGGP